MDQASNYCSFRENYKFVFIVEQDRASIKALVKLFSERPACRVVKLQLGQRYVVICPRKEWTTLRWGFILKLIKERYFGYP
jgi:hypothetical protein